MAACPSCGTENADGAKFCNECATLLAGPGRPVAEERKVITSLFCDLIGFTATSESADPEDVDQRLSAYSAMARAQIEAPAGGGEVHRRRGGRGLRDPGRPRGRPRASGARRAPHR